MKTIRCSSLPLLWKCGQSQEIDPASVAINDYSEPAELGTAAHKWAAAHVSDKSLDIRQLAEQYAVDQDELSMLTNCAKRIWEQLRTMFRNGPFFIEQSLSANLGPMYELTGQIDFRFIEVDSEAILDWKFGRVESDYSAQTRGYALLSLLDDRYRYEGDPKRITTITAWARDGVVDVEHFDVDELLAWRDDLVTRLRNNVKTYSAGAHCAYCVRRLNCPARQELVKSVMAELSIEGQAIVEWTPETRQELGPAIGDAYGRVKLVEAACEAFRQQLKIDLEANGELPIGGGRRLYLADVNRRVLDAGKAMSVLDDYVDPSELLQCTTISLPKIEKAAMAKAGKGNGAKIARELEAGLKAADALRIVTTQQLKEGKAT